MTQMITLNDNDNKGHERKQAHKGEPHKTPKRWLEEIPIRHIHDRTETKEIRRLIYAGGQQGKYKRVSKQHFHNTILSLFILQTALR